MSDSVDLFANYRQLLAKVDALCDGILTACQEEIVCAPGCDSCCRHLSLLPVEAGFLRQAAAALPKDTRRRLRQQESGCPLLTDGRCLLYPDRPIICRTHGLPLFIESAAGPRVDFCPKNFTGRSAFSPAELIDLERLNEILVSVDALYCQQSNAATGRTPIAEILDF